MTDASLPFAGALLRLSCGYWTLTTARASAVHVARTLNPARWWSSGMARSWVSGVTWRSHPHPCRAVVLLLTSEYLTAACVSRTASQPASQPASNHPALAPASASSPPSHASSKIVLQPILCSFNHPCAITRVCLQPSAAAVFGADHRGKEATRALLWCGLLRVPADCGRVRAVMHAVEGEAALSSPCRRVGEPGVSFGPPHLSQTRAW